MDDGWGGGGGREGGGERNRLGAPLLISIDISSTYVGYLCTTDSPGVCCGAFCQP